MTKAQKDKIKYMRECNIGYAQIAKEIGATINSVKSYCHRQGLNTEALISKGDCCKNCGKVITEKSKTRPRKFCSVQCKTAWWNLHRRDRQSDNIVEFTCSVCGKHFKDYAHTERKFCSLACYRMRGEDDGN